MAYFDHFAKVESTRLSDFFTVFKIDKEFKNIKKFIKDNKREILEIGPGKGKLAMKFLENNFKNYDIVEPNDLMRNALLKQGVRSAKNYLVPHLKEADESYDVIIASDLVEHLNDAREAQIFISEISRVLKKNGIVAILSPDCLSWKEDFFNCDFSHSYVTTVRRMILLFYNHNIETLKFCYFSFFLTGVAAQVGSFLIKHLLFFAKGNQVDSKLYKLKLMFLRRFLIIGRKNA